MLEDHAVFYDQWIIYHLRMLQTLEKINSYKFAGMMNNKIKSLRLVVNIALFWSSKHLCIQDINKYIK